jgi:hypothetical protein
MSATLAAPTATRHPAQPETEGAVRSVPLMLLRLEGLGLMGAALAAYSQMGGDWGLFAWLFLVPDLAMLGYLAGPAFGAAAYNAAHTTLLPLVLGAFGVLGAAPLAVSIALIWLAHVGFDRAMGYGLKYASGFGHTHLGRAIGRARQTGG